MRYTDPVRVLRGVGSQRQTQLAKLGISTLGDLLYHFPRRYLDLTERFPLLEAPFDVPAAVCCRVEQVGASVRLDKGRTITKVQTLSEDGGRLVLVFFNNQYTPKTLKIDESYLFYGTLEYNGTQLRTMTSPQVFPPNSPVTHIPMYRLTAGLSDYVLRSLVEQALPTAWELPEVLPPEVRLTFDLPEIGTALENIHAPTGKTVLESARRRLMFEELFVLAAGMAALGQASKRLQSEPLDGDLSLTPFYNSLPFGLTGAQKRCITEILGDLQRPVPANRLVQGDVGSGKTMVAAAAAYYAFTAGAQTAFMAPTELLAQQHYHTMTRLLSPLGVRTALLTGSLTAKQKREVYALLSAGEIDFVMGTHALFSKDVEFSRLRLVITDEQHRFGVVQREALRKKGFAPHTVVMSATPIPRTLALMIYGELALSTLDEMPPGRQTIETYRADDKLRPRVYRFIRQQLDAGRQAYVVCPLVAHTDETDPQLCAATKLFEDLSDGEFAGYRLGLLHGKMKPKDKDAVMAGFLAGGIQLLISTTVVEVGVDVPNAVVMAIENAERFGLSQLHQLRGRVGRGKHKSYCVLLTNTKFPATRERISYVCKTADGFRLAEYDLQTRGPGNFLGQQQHGLPEMRLADLATDGKMVEDARIAALGVLKADPALTEHPALAEAVSRVLQTVGERPN